MEISKDTTIAITFTAGELFALQQALLSAGYSAQEEATAHDEYAVLSRHLEDVHTTAAEAARQRADLYLELASRVGHRAGELDEDVPAGFGSFPRRGDGGTL